MISVAIITRSTLYTVKGGDTVQVEQTASCLRKLGVMVDIKLTHQKIDYTLYDLLHFFNIIRPSDILFHIDKTTTPFVISTIFVDYSEYDQFNRSGLSGWLLSFFSANRIEYIKTIVRWLLGRDRLMSKKYILRGQKQSIQTILKRCRMILPNSVSEMHRLENAFMYTADYTIIPNGIDLSLFKADPDIKKDPTLVICVARIEGIKNQLNLIHAINGTQYHLLLIGSPAPNQPDYYKACKKIAGDNIDFIDHLSHAELVTYYKKAKVHVLPSWFETTGLSSLEAAAMGCNIVITDKGDTRDYFADEAFYCNPASPESILEAIENAASTPVKHSLQQKVQTNFTWEKAATATMNAYKKILAIA